MSKSLTYKELKTQGLSLTKEDANDLLHRVSRIAQHGAESNEVFGEPKETGSSQANNIQKSTGFETNANAAATDKVRRVTKKDLKDVPVLAERGLKVGDVFPTEEELEAFLGQVPFIVTQEHLNENPELAENGVKVGDTVYVAKNP